MRQPIRKKAHKNERGAVRTNFPCLFRLVLTRAMALGENIVVFDVSRDFWREDWSLVENVERMQVDASRQTACGGYAFC